MAATAVTDAATTFEAWLVGHLPADWVDAVRRGDGPAVEALAVGDLADEMIRAAAADGWLTPDWPETYGGRGLSTVDASTVKSMLREWHVGDVRYAIGTAWVGPTILQWGDDEQKQRWLPPIAAAEEMWCQLFSEPDAGSDLASLRTTARRVEPGRWQLDGVKMWTSRANLSRRGLLIARTDTSLPKHRGLTAFGLDMTAPGVTIRPIKQMTGDAEFYEVELREVSLDDADRLGPEGSGWDVCRTALSFERIAGSGVGAAPPGSVVGRPIEELIAHGAATWTPIQRDRVVREWMIGRLITLSNRRAAAARAAGRPAGAEGSVTKVMQAEHTRRLQELFVDLDGPAGVAFEAGDPWAAYNEWAFLRVRAKTIAGGTSEVLRNQLAERILGLPRDGDDSRTMAWSDFVSKIAREVGR